MRAVLFLLHPAEEDEQAVEFGYAKAGMRDTTRNSTQSDKREN